MARSSTKSFVTELEILPTGKQAKKIRARFEAARQVYNACLGESLKRLKLMRESRAWQQARKVTDKKQRSARFKEIQQAFGFREYDLHKWATQFTKSWINEHLGARTVEATASAAFKTTADYLYDAGKRKRPRFRRKGDLRAVDGKSGSCCRWKEDHLVWKGLNLTVQIDPDDPVVQHGLEQRVKYVRMIRKVIRGRERFFAQLICEGTAYQKPAHQPGSGIVGIDIGTQTIAVVGERDAWLDVFCQEIERDHRRIRKIQRALDRSRRANNPANFLGDGRINTAAGRLEWIESRNYRHLKNLLANLLRKEADHRKNLHGQMVARILHAGDQVRMEKLNFQSFARKAKRDGNKRRKRFGKSIASRAPGLFVERLKREAEKWGADVTEFSTVKTKLSQTCSCGHVAKKQLSQRVHNCPKCGAFAQRDLYSAYLARYVQGDILQADQAHRDWSCNCEALKVAWSNIKHANGLPSSLGLRTRDRAARLQNGGQNPTEIQDAVPAGSPARESLKEVGENRHHTILTDVRAPFSGSDSHRKHSSRKRYGESDADTG